ncbi:MAG: delta-aminolevulinic acid dehydratase [Bacteroidetes bacterium]|nr:delta-aminolevulinic acid dehydratase [Bacteroidota bacterium]
MEIDTKTLVNESFLKLWDYVEANDYKGWDPYDGLNSRVFQRLPLSKNYGLRLAWIQLFKRSPINLRSVLGVEKEHNAKGLALFLSGYTNLYNIDPCPEYRDRMELLRHYIKANQSSGYSGACWGYGFDWQARAFFQPKGTPTIVATTFVAYSLLDYYEISGDSQLLKMARSSCDFILNDLNRTYDDKGNFCFSYSPRDKTSVFNASLLGSRLLSRVYSLTREEVLLEAASKSVAFCTAYQQSHGGWAYSTLPFHSWIDNYHTGFNLESLTEYRKYTGDLTYDSVIQKGLDFYLSNFFTVKGESKYYYKKLYPIDIHAPAQLIVTMYRMNLFQQKRELIDRVTRWTIEHMFDTRGYFYYQIKRLVSSRIPYMRWAQAWMFYGLSFYKKAAYEK